MTAMIMIPPWAFKIRGRKRREKLFCRRKGVTGKARVSVKVAERDKKVVNNRGVGDNIRLLVVKMWSSILGVYCSLEAPFVSNESLQILRSHHSFSCLEETA